MWLSRIKWMVLGIAITSGCFLLYTKKETLRTLSGTTHNKSISKINPEFASFINAFTTGYISSGSSIKVKLSSEFAGNTQLNTALKEEYFTISPSVEGETFWKDAQTLEFKPKERLKPGQDYKVTFHLDKLLEVKYELREFEFPFTVVKQSVKLEVNELKCYHANDYEYYNLTGSIGTADFAEQEAIEKMLNAKFDNKDLSVKWVHNEQGTLHQFLIDSIERPTLLDSKLRISCQAKLTGLDYNETRELLVPKSSSFVLLNAKIANDNDQYVLLTFSNPLSLNQSLEGLIKLSDYKEIKYIVASNQVLIYPANSPTGSHKLTVSSLVKCTNNEALQNDLEYNLKFSEAKPSLRFMGDGTILPSANNMAMAFETVNIRAVDVKIIRIYENNILQFLQDNNLNGNYNIARVGKQLIKKRINLGITNPTDFAKWKKFSLDIGSLIKAEPGAIYNVVLSFKKSYSACACLGNNKEGSFEMEELEEAKEEETGFGYYYDDYYGSYEGYEEGESYDWSERNNPCKATYYTQFGTISKNILASDIALTVKRGNDASIMVVAADIITAKPLDNVSIEFYDYQKQLIQTANTNKDGQLFITPVQSPAFIVARKNKQTAYLRLNDGESLSLTMYDVSGDAIRKGIKGFIYGERGVWRPGDSIYLNFILEDKLENIPTGHPVILSLFNPQGQLVKKQMTNKSVGGFYKFATATDKNAPTGYWNAEIKVGAIKFNKNIRVETVMPNRLKINVNIGDNKLLSNNRENPVTISTAWLTGAKAKKLPVKMSVALSKGITEFAGYKEYNFTDDTRKFEAQSISLFDGKANEEGNLSFPLNINIQKNAPGMLKAAITTQVFEPGGTFSIDRFSMNYSPYTTYTGVKLPDGEKKSGILYTGKDHIINIVTLDSKGKPVSCNNLRFEMYKMNWRWWWDQYEEELAGYTTDDYHKRVKFESFSSSNGKAEMKVNIAEGEWGRYLIRITDADGGHSSTAIAYFDWANWMDREGSSETKILSNMLTFNTDKESYKTGEEVSVTIPSPNNGRALVTIENGSRVLEAHWLDTEKGSTVFKFKISPQMAPNVYLHVSLIQPHAHTNDLPIRLYGVVAINVDNPETHLQPQITMPEVLVPEQNVNVTISEQNGKEMAFTLAMVDEGLLDLTRFKTPNPHTAFYAKEALGVKTWDLYDNVIGAYGAELERILSIGGDGSEINRDGAKANRFKPMVKFFGPYHISKGEKKNITIKMPMYVGSVRTMVIAGYKGAYGVGEKTTPVKAPLMVLGTLPRILSVTEEVKFPISIFGGDKNIGATTVKLEVNGLLQINGTAIKTINVAKDDEQLVNFDLKVKNLTGIAKAKVTASGAGFTTVYELELDVRNPNPYQTVTRDVTIEAGKSITEKLNPFGLNGTSTGMVELSTFPSIDLEGRLKYLVTYPHGCVEQTTSKSLAQLYLGDLMELSTDKKAEVESNIRSGIYELSKFQLPSGSLSYWQGSNDVSDWGTSYAGHFLIMAEKKGYTLPSGFKKNWIMYQQTTAQNYVFDKGQNFYYDETQAYRLYVLALANNPVVGAMNRLRENSKISNMARWWLAAAYSQIGQMDEAEKLLAAASLQAKEYKVDYYTYGSTQRDMSVILQTLCLMNKKQQAFAQLKKVAAFLSSQNWCSTQTTAFGLVAVATFAKKFGASSAMQAGCSINGKENNLKGNNSVTQLPVNFLNNNAAEIVISNKGTGPLYTRFISRGKPAIGEEKEANENIALEAVYKDLSGAVINPEEIEQGTNFMLTITIRNLGLVGEIKNLALNNYIPSGWEIRNARMDDNEAALKNSAYTYQDIKDDKVLTYFDLNKQESKIITLMLNASYQGHFYLPAINAEAMYDNSIYARNKGTWIKVVKTKTTGVAKK